jgi:hypothetical protein
MVIEDEDDKEMDADKSLEEERLCQKVNRASAYFSMDGNCRTCRSSISSYDISLKMNTKRLEDVCVESETIRLLDQYEVILHPIKEEMEIAKLKPMKNKNGEMILLPMRYYTHTLVELDFSNPQRSIDRIQTLITFS